MRKLALALSLAVLGSVFVAGAASAAGKSQFQVRCMSSHVAQHDPIVAPNMMSAHMHEFFGNRLTNANPSYDRMLTGSTTCSTMKDTAAYWTPTLIKNGKVVRASNVLTYYRGSFVHERVQPFPKNLKMVSSDFSMGTMNNMTLRVKFPSCWDGKRLDSADHISHMAYPRSGCPASHPVAVPRITQIFRYPTDVRGGRLSSGEFSTGHADFWNTWVQSELTRLVDRCINGHIDCGRIDS